MRKEAWFEWLILAITLLPFAYLAWVWGSLPEQVPTHFNINGEPDRFSSKAGLVLPIAMVTLLTWALMRFLPAIDPRGRIVQENPSVLRNIRVITAVFTSAIALVIVRAAQDGGESVRWLPVVIGGFFAGLGNYLINVKPNYFIGFRTPWTLESETVWRKTHRVGGRWMFVGGIAMIVAGLVLPTSLGTVAILVISLVSALGPVVLSYLYYKKEQ